MINTIFEYDKTFQCRIDFLFVFYIRLFEMFKGHQIPSRLLLFFQSLRLKIKFRYL